MGVWSGKEHLLTPHPLLLTKKRRSQPISRVLSWAIIPLGSVSPLPSSNLPGGGAGRTSASLFGLAPDGVCRAAGCCHLRGALLPHPFTLTEPKFGGLLSVALSVGFHRPGVTWHPALWSPDFPPTACAVRDCLADSANQWCGLTPEESRGKEAGVKAGTQKETATLPMMDLSFWSIQVGPGSPCSRPA